MVKNRAGLNKWPYYICGKKIRVSHDSCEGRAVNSAKADQVILEAILSRISHSRICSSANKRNAVSIC